MSMKSHAALSRTAVNVRLISQFTDPEQSDYNGWVNQKVTARSQQGHREVSAMIEIACVHW